MNTFRKAFAGKRIFVTGASGFKGSWLCSWLIEMGAKVSGYSLSLPTEPSMFAALRLDERMQFHQVDLFDYPLFEFPPYDLALASKILEVAEEQKLDVLHMHYAIPHATAAYLARAMYRAHR